MQKISTAQQVKKASFFSDRQDMLRRKCACGSHTLVDGECPSCAKKKIGLQRKLKIGASNDPLECEVDRIADQVMAMPLNSGINTSLLRIQRFSGVISDGLTTAAASVDRVLAGSGRPLESGLRQDMESRFGYDFSQVRVHTGDAADQSARDVNAQAYTVGSDVIFGEGKFSPASHEGRRLIAHELTHVVQQRFSGIKRKIIQRNIGSRGKSTVVVPTSTGRILQRRRCTGSDSPDTIVDTHTVTPGTGIRSPGDSVEFNVRFNCEIRGLRSDIEDSGGTSLGFSMFPPVSTFPRDSYSREWDGKRLFTGVGTYMVDDGNYRHRLSRVLYAFRFNGSTGQSDELFASGEKLLSPNVAVSTRAGAFANSRSNHFSEANVETLARIIRSEMGIGNASEQRAIAWAVRNQMVRLNTRDASVVQSHFGDAHGSAPTDDDRHLAQEVLSVDMGNDTSGGAIKWFSPRSMPSEGESCARFDCGGGLITIADSSGVNQRKFAPTFHRDMRFVAIEGARDWFVRFYRL